MSMHSVMLKRKNLPEIQINPLRSHLVAIPFHKSKGRNVHLTLETTELFAQRQPQKIIRSTTDRMSCQLEKKSPQTLPHSVIFYINCMCTRALFFKATILALCVPKNLQSD